METLLILLVELVLFFFFLLLLLGSLVFFEFSLVLFVVELVRFDDPLIAQKISDALSLFKVGFKEIFDENSEQIFIFVLLLSFLVAEVDSLLDQVGEDRRISMDVVWEFRTLVAGLENGVKDHQTNREGVGLVDIVGLGFWWGEFVSSLESVEWSALILVALEHDLEEVSSVFREGSDVEVLLVELGEDESVGFKVFEGFQGTSGESEGIEGFEFESLMVNGDPVVEISAWVIVSDGVQEVITGLDQTLFVKSEEMWAFFVIDLLSDLILVKESLDLGFIRWELGESDNGGVNPFFFELILIDSVKWLGLALSVINQELVGLGEDSFEDEITSLEFEVSTLG